MSEPVLEASLTAEGLRSTTRPAVFGFGVAVTLDMLDADAVVVAAVAIEDIAVDTETEPTDCGSLSDCV